MSDPLAPRPDAQGVVHPRVDGDDPSVRLVSLVPSLTELLFDLDLGARLVGRTRYCVRPPTAVEALPIVGGTKRLHLERLRDLAPTHVLVNVDENTREMADAITRLGARLIVTHPRAPRDNLDLYHLLGHLFTRDAQALALSARLEAALARVQARAADLAPRRALYLIWRAPWMTLSADTYIARMLALLNLHPPPLPATDARYPQLEITPALLSATDLWLFSSEPFPFSQSDLDAFAAAHPAAHRLALVDGEMLSWYGSRAIPAMDYLLDVVLPLRG